MNATNAELLQELDDARVELWAVLESIDRDTEIFPGWNKRDFFAHIGAWEANVFEAFRDHIAGCPLHSSYAYPDNDAANAGFVAARRRMGQEDTQLEAEINRFAIKSLLTQIPDFDEVVIFPWGQESVVSWLKGAIEHERVHAEEIRQMMLARNE